MSKGKSLVYKVIRKWENDRYKDDSCSDTQGGAKVGLQLFVQEIQLINNTRETSLHIHSYKPTFSATLYTSKTTEFNTFPMLGRLNENIATGYWTCTGIQKSWRQEQL